MFGLRYSAITLGSRGAVRRKGGARTSSPRWLDQIELSCTDEEDKELNLSLQASHRLKVMVRHINLGYCV